jgi:hypothetical protein
MTAVNRIRCYLADSLDRVVNALKWPFALTCFFFLPSCFLVCWPSLMSLLRSSSLPPFMLGILAFGLVCRLIKRTVVWNWLWVLEHETVHLLTGLLCLKVPKRWLVSSKGGYVGFDRGGNWLIIIAPYVIPLIPLLAFGVLQIVSTLMPLKPWVLPACMGFSMAAHVAFTWMESDFRQPDIQRLGGLFSLLVAPTLHLIFLAVVLIVSGASKDSTTCQLSDLFQEVGKNGVVAWRAVADRGSSFICAKTPTEVPDTRTSAETYAVPQPTKTATSASTGIRFERKSASKHKTDSP